ncbi:DNA methyltransferase [uncultured Psychromonas sp.]|uniref:DNA methyltransferase n=1 Tax=uncultured Psychromonas sp. TaxID=173974 RepID=UPI00260D3F5E|nr:DNA methyltransferase [uncultured Psychromonas sp.]
MSTLEESLELFPENQPIFKQFLPTITRLNDSTPIINEWDIPSTIKQLSYFVHSHYRYYGKFPSAVAGQILEQFPSPSEEHYVLDNFCGSGTTLVEAKLRGIKSYGLDISWLSVLASNVKVTTVDIANIKKELNELVSWFENNKSSFNVPEIDFTKKWFEDMASRDLLVIQQYLLTLDKSTIRDFLIVAFIGIVRRVSKAHNGEVRPHINKKKKQRDVISAFSKKVNDMCSDHDDFQKNILETSSECCLGDNLNLPEKFDDGKCYLVISHPPYLNSFNYAPVFNLEFYWGQVFEDEYTQGNSKLYKTEMKAHPANESIQGRYFNHLKSCYEEVFKIQNQGGVLAVVIGDCTRNGKLVPVLKKTIDIVESIGYKLEELNYRTTHYGLGKYAYNHRADYHGDQEEKKDGILIFKKP